MNGPVDYTIVLQPADPKVDFRGDGWLEILPEDATVEDAIEALEGWAETFEQYHVVPDCGDWQSRPGIAVTRRQGRKSYRVRCDAFEREGETGMTVGTGWLRIKETPRDEPAEIEVP